jgi:hypothetical protein
VKAEKGLGQEETARESNQNTISEEDRKQMLKLLLTGHRSLTMWPGI